MARRSPRPSPDSGWVRLLDDVFRIPGTNIRFGLDGIVGLLFPAIGDAVTASAAATLLIRALRERVPTIILVRMLGNVGIDFLLGLVPGLGDLMDFFYKGARRNLRLIERFSGQGRGNPSWLLRHRRGGSGALRPLGDRAARVVVPARQLRRGRSGDLAQSAGGAAVAQR